MADTATTAEAASVTIAGVDNDTDTDGGPKNVATINGTAVGAGQSVTLASGAIATLNANLTIAYNPNGKFAYLVSTATAGGNPAYASSATDTFCCALNGGSSTTVTVTVTGVDGAGDELRGTAGTDAITGTPGIDINGETIVDLSIEVAQTADFAWTNADFRFGAVISAIDTLTPIA